MTDQGLGGDAEPDPNQPPSWSPVQPPTYGGGYGTRPASPLRPRRCPHRRPPAYGQPPGTSYYGQPPYGPPPPYPPGAYPQAPKPGIVPLRPLGVGEILDGALQTIRRYPKPVLGLTVVVVTVSQLLQVALTVPLVRGQHNVALDDPNITTDEAFHSLSGSFSTAIVAGIIPAIARLFLTGVLIVMVSRAVLGQPVTVRGAWTSFKPSVGRLLLLSLAVIGLLLVGCLALCVGAIYVWVVLALAPAALVLERAGVGTAISRSRSLVQGSWWRVFGILVLASILGAVATLIITIPFTIAGFGASGMFSGVGGHRGGLSRHQLHRLHHRRHADLPVLGGRLSAALHRPADAQGGSRHRALPGELPRLSGPMAIEPVLQRLIEPPIAIGRDQARTEAARELSRPVYHQHDPNALERASQWFWDKIGELLSHTGVLGGLPLVGLIAIGAVVAVVVSLLIWRYGVPARDASTRSGDVFTAGPVRTSREHAALAVAAAREGRWAEAVQERFRALVRGLEERDLVPSGAGRTAAEAMAAARIPLPGLGPRLTGAATSFDDVTYGGREGNESTYQRLTDLEAEARTTRPSSAAGVAPTAFALPR